MTRPLKVKRRGTGLLDRAHTKLVVRSLGSCGRDVEVRMPAMVKNPQAIRIGDGVVIREHAWLNCEPGALYSLTIGNGSYIGRFADINAAESVVIEDEVLIADRVHISDYQHAFGDLTRSILTQGLTDPEPVHIKWGSWVGAGAVIMPGVTIGRGAIVGANAVVTRDVGEFEIVGGVPAVVIGSRDDQNRLRPAGS